MDGANEGKTEFCRKPCLEKRKFCRKQHFKRPENCRSQMRCGIKTRDEVFHLNELYEDYIREKVYEQLIEMAKRMLEDGILSLEKIAEYSGLELAEILDLQANAKK